jgi:hypothetical protein
MISSEVQRTLVKSPPELWAELSDPAALARHLGELGDIRIIRTVPERTVEWAAEDITGTVSIKPSGWGTKVILSVTREITQEAPAQQAAAEASCAIEPAPAPWPTIEPIPAPAPASPAIEPMPGPATAAGAIEPDPEPAPWPTLEAESTDAPEPAPEAELEPRRSFLARLFGRRRGTALAAFADQSALEEQSMDPPAADIDPALAPTAIAQETTAEREGDISAELMAAEEVVIKAEAAELLAAEQVAAEEVTAVLSAVLDRLGAAHHRPFSRA